MISVEGMIGRKKERRNTMEIAVIIALIVAIPVVIFPAAFVWYINIGGLLKARQPAKKPAPEVAR